ncbi:hypothetical protein FB451DRAFT_698857 [Mycena latifolia]|nr:hypothetical protein FB451DRAFT_698857 [Mycena latifolia]
MASAPGPCQDAFFSREPNIHVRCELQSSMHSQRIMTLSDSPGNPIENGWASVYLYIKEEIGWVPSHLMFQPFDNASQFYSGLIVWCDPNCYEMDLSTLGPDEVYDRKKARELRPCLIVAVDYTNQTFQVARLCATTPRDTRRWWCESIARRPLRGGCPTLGYGSPRRRPSRWCSTTTRLCIHTRISTIRRIPSQLQISRTIGFIGTTISVGILQPAPALDEVLGALPSRLAPVRIR